MVLNRSVLNGSLTLQEISNSRRVGPSLHILAPIYLTPEIRPSVPSVGTLPTAILSVFILVLPMQSIPLAVLYEPRRNIIVSNIFMQCFVYEIEKVRKISRLK